MSSSDFVKDNEASRKKILKNLVESGECKRIAKKRGMSHFPAFCEQYLKSFPSDYLDFLSISDLVSFIHHRFQFIHSAESQKCFDEKEESIHVLIHPEPKDAWIVNAHIIEIALPDMPFIKNSLLEFVQKEGMQIRYLISDVYNPLTGNTPESKIKNGNSREKFCFYAVFIIDRVEDFNSEKLKAAIIQLYKHIRYVSGDFITMKQSLEHFCVSQKDVLDKKVGDFFKWLMRDNFIFFSLSLAKEKFGLFKEAEYSAAILKECQKGLKNSVSVFKTEQISRINRSENIVVIAYNDLLITGIFTRKADNSPSLSIPILSGRVKEMLKQRGKDWTTLDARDYTYAFDILPIVYRFIIPLSGYIDFSSLLFQARLTIEGKIRLRSFKEGQYFLLIAWPLQRLNEEFNNKLKKYFEKKRFVKKGEVNRVLSNVVFFLYEFSLEDANAVIEAKDYEGIEVELISHLISWERKFFEEAEKKFSFEKFHKYKKLMQVMLESDYKDRHLPKQGLVDLEYLHEVLDKERIIKGEYDSQQNKTYVKILIKKNYNLSFFVPIFSNMDLNVISEESYEFCLKNSTVYFFKFRLEYKDSPVRDKDTLNRICETMDAVMLQQASSEPMNSLIMNSSLSIYQVELLKALLSYFFQIKKTYSRVLQKKTLQNSPRIAAAVVDLFELKFLEVLNNNHNLYHSSEKVVRKKIKDYPVELVEVPEYMKNKKQAIKSLEIKNLVQKELYLSLQTIINEIVRTNYFTHEDFISFKITSSNIPFVTPPSPLFEIWVYHPHFEGIHLRGGMVARGGIRWSDRPDDFRTEVWGLWKTQVLKNTIIVPTGAKGGFVLKYLANTKENAIAMYEKFMTALISLTDNRLNNEIIKNKKIPVLDHDDSYLVVAADKGTASFSDFANEISVKNGYWLGDAFASGGKTGFSHKALGITALGAWESGRWHFYKKGIDPKKDKISVIAIGDMSGDVFGNGMIFSDKIRLIGAFNHSHIFLDPAPDCEVSFKERRRLFDEAGNWTKYNESLISKGGGIFERESASINLSAKARQVLDTQLSQVNGEELIRLLLKAPVDILFNGGIGTYIKASFESHHEIDDMNNDSVRINGKEVRAGIIVEGGNLGVSQAGRIEYALNGGLINTDAIDNSAGVDLSDHEVNLKILFSIFKDHGLIKNDEERNKKLKKLSAEETRLVLKNNFRQNWALVYLESLPPEENRAALDLIELLKKENLWAEHGENLKDNQTLLDCLQKNVKLPPPLLSVLHSLTKFYIEKNFFIPENSENYIEELSQYFPEELGSLKYLYIKHPLKSEIIKTMLVNKVVDFAGFPWLVKSIKYLNLSVSQSIRYYVDIYQALEIGQLKLKRHLPDIENRKFPAETEFGLTLLIKRRIEKAIFRTMELMVLFNKDLEKERRHQLPLLGNDILAKMKVDNKNGKLTQDEAFELQQLSNVELRFGYNYFIEKDKKAKAKSDYYFGGISEVYHNCGIQDLKKDLDRVYPQNSWEVQSLLSLKRQFWSGLFKSDPEKIKKRLQKMDFIKELRNLRESNKLSLSTISGITSYLFES